jgi:hypothetical protein
LSKTKVIYDFVEKELPLLIKKLNRVGQDWLKEINPIVNSVVEQSRVGPEERFLIKVYYDAFTNVVRKETKELCYLITLDDKISLMHAGSVGDILIEESMHACNNLCTKILEDYNTTYNKEYTRKMEELGELMRRNPHKGYSIEELDYLKIEGHTVPNYSLYPGNANPIYTPKKPKPKPKMTRDDAPWKVTQ